MMNNSSLAEQAQPFLSYLEDWMRALPIHSAKQAFPDPQKTAVICVDVIQGFCYEGPLSSPRVAGIVEPITRLFELAHDCGVRNIILTQDTHEPEAVEFAQWPPHCVRGTSESQTVEAFRRLPFFGEMQIFEKNSIHSALNTGLTEWIEAHPEVNNYIVTGDCTDLCTYQLAMHLRLDANARQLNRRVLLPANCVQTYDMPLETARELGSMPHPGDLMHAVFLYHMQLNGVEIVAEIH